MKKLLPLTLVLLLALLLAACAQAGLAEVSDAPSEPPAESAPAETPEAGVTPPPLPTEKPPETPVPTVSMTPLAEDWQGIFEDFLKSDYDKLYEAFYGGITGIGYIDLDLDGSAELLLFDAGASAAMGLQVFDIVDSRVELISANMLPVSEAYAGEYTRPVYVNANSFADFRLLEDSATGLRFFTVTSGNGALDFNYTELIAFERGEMAVVPVSLYYKYVELNEAGEITSSRFEREGKPISESEYDSGMAAFNVSVSDLSYEAAGVFIWENASYQNGFDGFMAMADAALSRYIPAADYES